jgi:hypothetical protein
MLRSIANRVLSGGRRTATPATTRRPAPGGTAAGGSANREIERGAKSLLRGVGRKRRGL